MQSRDASDWSVGDDDDDGKDAPKSRDWDRDSTEFSVPVKKTGALDAEFAKMLGLKDEMGAPSPSFDDDKPPPNDMVSDNDNDSSSFKYTPTIRGTGAGRANTPDNLETAKPPVDDDKPAGGLSAVFFSEDADGGDSTSLFSSLSSFSASDRRGGRRGGRRSSDGGEGEDDSKLSAMPVRDPFASKTSDLFGAKPAAPTSFDSLFGSGRGSATAVDDPFASRRETQDEREGESLFGKREARGNERLDRDDKEKHVKSDDRPLPAAKKLSTPPKESGAKASSVQDDLLAELLSGDDKSTHRDREEQPPIDDLAGLSSRNDAFGGGERRGPSRRGHRRRQRRQRWLLEYKEEGRRGRSGGQAVSELKTSTRCSTGVELRPVLKQKNIGERTASSQNADFGLEERA